VVIFVPIGLFSSLLMDRPRWWKAALVALFLSAFIEACQLFIPRGTDVDDLILNTLGGLWGYWAFLLLRKRNPGFVGRCGKLRKGSG
jgi:glycopeptide antibiotics resistance protein